MPSPLHRAEPSDTRLVEILDRILDKGMVITGHNNAHSSVRDTEESFSLLGLHVITAETEVAVHPQETEGDQPDERSALPWAA